MSKNKVLGCLFALSIFGQGFCFGGALSSVGLPQMVLQIGLLLVSGGVILNAVAGYSHSRKFQYLEEQQMQGKQELRDAFVAHNAAIAAEREDVRKAREDEQAKMDELIAAAQNGQDLTEFVTSLNESTASVNAIYEKPAPQIEVPPAVETGGGEGGQSEEEILANDPDPSSQATDESSAPESEVPIPGTPHTVVNDPDIQRPADATEADSTDSGTPKDFLSSEDIAKDETDESGDGGVGDGQPDDGESGALPDDSSVL